MKLNVLQKLTRRERRVMNRIDKANWSGQSPMIAPPSISYELADRVRAMNAGGLGVIQQMVKQRQTNRTLNFSLRTTWDCNWVLSTLQA